MKVIKPFFLGGAAGLALALAIAAGLFASPIRKGLYLDWDPEIADLRGRMGGLQNRLQSDEISIAESESAVPLANRPPADSLKASQAGAWKEYRHWRNRLGELARRHDHPRPAEFFDWAYSMRHGLGPMAAALALLPALFLAWRGSRQGRGRAVRSPGRPAQPAPSAHNQAETMTSLESAIKQVARIAATNHGEPPVPPVRAPRREAPSRANPVRHETRGNREETLEKETEYLPEVPRRIPVAPEAREPRESALREPVRAMEEGPKEAPAPPEEEILQAPDPSPYETGGNIFREPETAPLPFVEDDAPSGGEPRPEGMETQIIKLGPGGWGEARRVPPAAPSDAPRSASGGLSMEDEEEEESIEEAPPAPGAFMPPTTEVERVERRKAEVLKLARKGLTSSEISKRLRISQDQVEFIIRMRREKG